MSAMIVAGDRVEVFPDLHHPDTPSGLGTVVRTYVQTDPRTFEEGPMARTRWQHVYTVRLDSGGVVDAPSRFVGVTPA